MTVVKFTVSSYRLPSLTWHVIRVSWNRRKVNNETSLDDAMSPSRFVTFRLSRLGRDLIHSLTLLECTRNTTSKSHIPVWRNAQYYHPTRRSRSRTQTQPLPSFVINLGQHCDSIRRSNNEKWLRSWVEYITVLYTVNNKCNFPSLFLVNRVSAAPWSSTSWRVK